MGTDINRFAERRTPEGWELVHCDFYFGGDRNYMLHAALAGVRSRDEIAPLAQPRGLPRDVSSGGREIIAERARHHRVTFEEFCQNDVSHHSHSWVTLQELVDYPWHRNSFTLQHVEALREQMIRPLGEIGPPGDVRVVFWFDS